MEPEETPRQKAARSWFRELRDDLVASFEEIERDYAVPEAERLAPGRFQGPRRMPASGPAASAW